MAAMQILIRLYPIASVDYLKPIENIEAMVIKAQVTVAISVSVAIGVSVAVSLLVDKCLQLKCSAN